MKVLKPVSSWLRGLFRRYPGRRRAVIVQELPDRFCAEEIYLIGENGHFWCAAMLCPCGCSEVIQLNLVAGTRPLWSFELDSVSQTITLYPSVWRTVGCRSHFSVRLGRVQWHPRGLWTRFANRVLLHRLDSFRGCSETSRG